MTPTETTAAIEETNLEVIDGFMVDPTGEIVGHVQCQADFHVTSADAAAWVLQKMMDADAAVLASEVKRRAIFENIDADIRHHAARRKYLEWRFGPELAAYARANLRGKSKTWVSPWGKVSFRTTQPGIEVTDEALALAYVKSLAIPGAVKVTEKIVLSECKSALIADPPQDGHGIAVKPAGESVLIKSGVE